MPKLSRGPHLYKRKQGDAKVMWYIRDNDKRISTGFDTNHTPEAKEALAAHTRGKYVQPPGENYYVQQALDLYQHDVIPRHAKPIDGENHLARLREFFRGHECDHVTPGLTILYERWRCHTGKPALQEPPRVRKAVSAASVRRELETLRAALSHAWRCRKLKAQIPVSLPPKSPPRQRWLTCSEAGRLLAAAIGIIPAAYCDIATRSERWTIWRRDRTAINRHLAKFILIGLATGTRSDAILSMAWTPHADGGHFDIDRRLMFRAAPGEIQTKKRKPPAPIPDQLLRHLRRWKRLSGGLFVITAPGTMESIARVSKSFNAAVVRAGLDRKVTPHTLRHSCVSHLMQAGRPAWEVGSFVGMSVQMVLDNYGHHSPNFLRETANATRAAE